MDYKDWHMLNILHEEKNITKTAERLYVSQPSLSYRLKNLEEEIGAGLIIKTRSGIEFTAEGEYLVAYARDMLKAFMVMKDNINNMEGEIAGTLKIGVSSNFAQYVLPDLLKSFSLKYPKVRFNVQTGWSSAIHSALSRGNIHIGILRTDYPGHKHKTLLNKEPLYIISQEKLDLKQLPGHRQIRYSTDTSLKETIQHWWADTYATPATIEMEVDRLETSKELVKRGLGYTIVPAICLKEEDHLHKEPVLDSEGAPITRDTWLMYNADVQHLVTVDKFITHMQEWGNINH
ncbi:LysR family transcriptional regulator [Salinicoccus halitifaciens]|uniref:DNA-binding transcriptional LysR family regulator n=1 Tax=Salinicoccus halitifaciens TaxID=1073415 RepID=A0ABV2E7V6_9STAP|nr:LysR family transcriptional regulator [Salinicoccus halitifaciens]MCD2136429.1 LysR family transcriptional regulator [Salinicoccus halitifaciens]